MKTLLKSAAMFLLSACMFSLYGCDNSLGIDDYSDLTEEQLAEKELICIDKDLQIYASNKTAVIVSPKWLAEMTMDIVKKYKPGENSSYEDMAAFGVVYIYKMQSNGKYYLHIVDVLSSELFPNIYYTKDGKLLEGSDLEKFLSGYKGDSEEIYPYVGPNMSYKFLDSTFQMNDKGWATPTQTSFLTSDEFRKRINGNGFDLTSMFSVDEQSGKVADYKYETTIGHIPNGLTFKNGILTAYTLAPSAGKVTNTIQSQSFQYDEKTGNILLGEDASAVKASPVYILGFDESYPTNLWILWNGHVLMYHKRTIQQIGEKYGK